MINKYESVPTVIEAVRVEDRASLATAMAWSQGEVDFDDDGTEDCAFEDIDIYVYDKLHDTYIVVNPGDWIIKGTEGEFYPCADKVFKQKYRPLNRDSSLGLYEPEMKK